MKVMKKYLYASIFSLICFQNVYAGGAITIPATLGSQKDTDNSIYAGLVWNLEDKFSSLPKFTIGFRSLRVESNNTVDGGDVSARFDFANGIVLDSWRFSYVGGKRDSLANIGLGYSMNKKSILSTFGIQVPYLRLGTDFLFNDKKFNPYIEALTADSPDKVDKEYECNDSSYSSLNGSNCNFSGVPG